MTEQTTAIPWANIKPIGKQKFVVLRPDKMVQGGAAPLIASVAANLGMTPDEVLGWILKMPQNAHAVRAIYKHLDGQQRVKGGATKLSEMRQQVRTAAYKAVGVQVDSRVRLYEKPFAAENGDVGWGLRTENNKPVLFPLRPAFEKRLAKAEEERKRRLRIKALKPTFAALKKQLDDVLSKVLFAENAREAFGRMTESNEREIALLVALDSMLAVKRHAPENPPAPADIKSIEDVKAGLADLRDTVTKAFVTDPVETDLRGQLNKSDKLAKELMGLIEADAFEDNFAKAVENWDIAPRDVQSLAEDALLAAARELVQSKQGEAFVNRHVKPMLDTLGSADLSKQLSKTAKTGNKSFDDALFNVTTESTSRSVFVGMAKLVPTTVGNAAGPATLCVSVAEAAGSILLQRVIKDPNAAKGLSGKLLRVIVATTRPGPLRVKSISGAVISKKFLNIKALDWSATYMKGPGIMSIVGICCLIALANDIDADESNTLKRWADIFASGSGSVLAISTALNNLSIISNNKVLGALARSSAGRVLGVLGGAASTWSSFEAARADLNEGDTTGAWLGGVGAAGSAALTVGGFMMAFGLGLDCTVVGAPIGVVLQVIGATIAIVSGVVGAIRAALTVGTELVFEGVLDQFARPLGTFDLLKTQAPQLEGNLLALRKLHNKATYWIIDLDRGGQLLADAGFSAEHIATMTHESEALVNNKVNFGQ